MRHSLLSGLVVTLIGLGFAAGPAYADCPADILKVEERLALLGGQERAYKSDAIQAIEKLLDKAKTAWSNGKTKKCENLARKASEKAKAKLN